MLGSGWSILFAFQFFDNGLVTLSFLLGKVGKALFSLGQARYHQTDDKMKQQDKQPRIPLLAIFGTKVSSALNYL